MPGTKLDRAGTFHARPVDWSLQSSTKANSKAKNINIRYEILDQAGKDAEGKTAWSTPWPAGVEVYGRHYVIGTDGRIIPGNVARIIRSLGWSGKFQDIGRTPQELGLRDCRIEVTEESYGGKTSLTVNWLNPYDYEGSGGMEGEDDATLFALDNERGAEMRAIVGQVAEEEKAATPPQNADGAIGQPVEAAGPPSPPTGDDIRF